MSEERPWEPLPIETALNRSTTEWRSIQRNVYLDGINDWTGIPREEDDRYAKLRFKVPERANYTDKNYLEGIDWEQYEDRDAIAREHPIHPNDENVGQQFINRIEPIFSKLRRRPLSHGDYSVHLVRAPRDRHDDYYMMKLAHKGTEIGSVSWSGDDGHVEALDVNLGHRHMTTKLLQEAWDVSRTQGHVGPAASGELSDYSGKIMKKFNPEAYEYRHSNYAYENDPENFDGDRSEYEDDDEARWERLSEEAYENHRENNGDPCETCGGAGESRLSPQTQMHRTENGYTVRFAGPGRYLETGSQTVYGSDSEGNDHEFEYYHPAFANNTLTMNHSPQKEGYVQSGVVRAQDDSGAEVTRSTWTKPCPACSHLNNPGFPNHEGN